MNKFKRSVFSDGRIVIVVGEIGAGKTWFAVDRILRHLATGGVVYTNIELKLDPWWSTKFKKRMMGVYNYLWQEYRWPLQDFQYRRVGGVSLFQDMSEVVKVSEDKKVLVVIDEALERWDTLYSSKDDLNKMQSSLSFLRHSRKYGCEIIIISQALSELTGRIRSKATDIVLVRDMGRWVVPKLGFRLPGCSRIIWAQWRDGSGKFKVSNEFISRTRPVGECYDTTQTLSLTVKSPEVNQVLDLVDYRSKRYKWVMLGSVVGAVTSFAMFFLFSNVIVKKDSKVSITGKKQIPLYSLAPSNSVIRINSGNKCSWWFDGELFEPGRTTKRGVVVKSDKTGFIVSGGGTNYVYLASDFF